VNNSQQALDPPLYDCR